MHARPHRRKDYLTLGDLKGSQAPSRKIFAPVRPR